MLVAGYAAPSTRYAPLATRRDARVFPRAAAFSRYVLRAAIGRASREEYAAAVIQFVGGKWIINARHRYVFRRGNWARRVELLMFVYYSNRLRALCKIV